MKDRTLLLAGLVNEDDFEETRHSVVENYEEQLEEDRKTISENIAFVEDDETRLIRLIGEQEEDPEWEGEKEPLNENIAMGGYGPGFAGAPSYALSSNYTPSQSEAWGAILGNNYHNKSKWADVSDPKVEIFRKIGNMSAYGFEKGRVNEDEELPEFDGNFRPIISENEFSAKDHYKSVMDRGRMPAIDQDEYPEIPGLEGPFRFRGGILYYDPAEGKYYDRKSDMYIDNSEIASLMEVEDGEKLFNGEMAVMGGIGPGFEAYDGVKKEIKNPYETDKNLLDRWYLGESSDINEDGKRSERIKKNLQQTDKILNRTEKRSKQKELQETEMIPEEVPDVITLPNDSFKLAGSSKRLGNLYLYNSDYDDLQVRVSKEPDGWYAEAFDAILGLVGEGEGPTVEDAVRDAASTAEGSGPETPSTLHQMGDNPMNENVSIGDRVGTPDDYHVRFREGDNPTMHPEAPEEPSSEAYPGLTGWKFYEADHTYQKIEDQKEDPLDLNEKDDFMSQLLDKFAVYDD